MAAFDSKDVEKHCAAGLFFQLVKEEGLNQATQKAALRYIYFRSAEYKT